MTAHLAGERYFGVKKGRMSMQVTVACDRHGGEVPGEHHVIKALKVGQVLSKRFPHLRFALEINPRNGSVKFFGWDRTFCLSAWPSRWPRRSAVLSGKNSRSTTSAAWKYTRRVRRRSSPRCVPTRSPSPSSAPAPSEK
jgi:hypothetical protein